MAISMIFPIDVGDNGVSVTGTSSTSVTTTSFGAQSFADWSATDAIKQNFKMLLLTRQGEYVMDPNYGIGLQDYLFMQEQEIETDALKSKIISQASEYLPYMTISNLEVTIDPLQSLLKIRVEFFYNELQIPEVFQLEVI